MKVLSQVFALCASIPLVAGTLARSSSLSPLELKHKKSTIPRSELMKRDDTDPSLLYTEYNISVPIDHFHNDTQYEPHSNGTFDLRYWFDATYYKPGGPVIVLQSGETSAEGRLKFLQKGILHQLAVATHGIGVVLEHRYYGTSFPTPDLSTENLRFLTTDQALADEAYFAKNVVFEGFEDQNLTAPNVAYIGYGGSYAGGFNAFLRKLYPDVFYGAIASSGVVEAIWDFWEYYEPIRVYAEPQCVTNTQKIVNSLDNVLIGQANDTKLIQEIKTLWGYPNVTYNDDFMSVVQYGIEEWQGRNWDPAENDNSFDIYCANITASTLQYPNLNSSASGVKKALTAGGYGSEVDSLLIPYLNMIGWTYDYAYNVLGCDGNQTGCFETHYQVWYDDIALSAYDYRSWPYQYCTEWGYLQTGSGVPENQLPLVSRLISLEYSSIPCVGAFNITTPPNVQAVNKFGGFNISYPRLAFLDGEQDPWRPATPHASPFNTTAHNRTSTVSEPFILIEGAVHHWDENGLFPNETTSTLPPKPVKDAQMEEVKFVKAWMKEWEEEQKCKKEKKGGKSEVR